MSGIWNDSSLTINGSVGETLQKQLEYSKGQHSLWQDSLKKQVAALEEARVKVERYRQHVKAYASDVERTGKLIETMNREAADNAS